MRWTRLPGDSYPLQWPVPDFAFVPATEPRARIVDGEAIFVQTIGRSGTIETTEDAGLLALAERLDRMPTLTPAEARYSSLPRPAVRRELPRPYVTRRQERRQKVIDAHRDLADYAESYWRTLPAIAQQGREALDLRRRAQRIVLAGWPSWFMLRHPDLRGIDEVAILLDVRGADLHRWMDGGMKIGPHLRFALRIIALAELEGFPEPLHVENAEPPHLPDEEVKRRVDLAFAPG